VMVRGKSGIVFFMAALLDDEGVSNFIVMT
jgi:hypothetical protein